MLPYSAKFARFNPLLKPDWRFQRLLQLAETHGGRPTRGDDRFVREAYRFFRAWKSGGKTADELFSRDPGLFVAFRLYESRTVERTASIMVENRLLAGESFASIAEKSRMTPDVIRWYHRLFFDVRSRLGARDWIFTQTIMPEIDRAYDRERRARSDESIVCQARLDPSLRILAYLGGPLLYDVLFFNAPVDLRPRSNRAVSEALDANATLAIKAKGLLAAMSGPISSKDAVKFAQFGFRLMKLNRAKGGDDQERFLAEAVDAIRRSENCSLRTGRGALRRTTIPGTTKPNARARPSRPRRQPREKDD